MKIEKIDLFDLEKQIISKYGEKTIKHPQADWTIEKEQDYLKQLKEMVNSQNNNNVFNNPKELIIKENRFICLICNHYSFNRNDDLYLNKYKSCKNCFILKIEGNENKWIKKLQENNLNK